MYSQIATLLRPRQHTVGVLSEYKQYTTRICIKSLSSTYKLLIYI